MMTASDVMTVRGVAGYLKVKDCSICRRIASKLMPGFRVGGSQRFRMAAIDRSTEAKVIGPGGEDRRVASRR